MALEAAVALDEAVRVGDDGGLDLLLLRQPRLVPLDGCILMILAACLTSWALQASLSGNLLPILEVRVLEALEITN